MIIIVDENIPAKIQDWLADKGFKIVSIRESFSGIDDFQIIKFAQLSDDHIILTEDKDFGEWVFSHHIKDISVVFLRYHFSETDKMVGIVYRLFNERQKELFGKFTTVTLQKIRSREI